MVVTLEDAKMYLRVDSNLEDEYIMGLIQTAEQLVMDAGRFDAETLEQECAITRVAVLYAAAYLFEHREEADFHELNGMLRYLLFGIRNEVF